MNRFEKIKNDKYFEYIINELKKKYEDLIFLDIELTDELFNVFYKTGSRLEYENIYFRKRSLLTASSILYFIYGKKEYYDAMINVILSICGEKTWALPAHVPYDSEEPECVIDLFNAETAQSLAEICSICDMPSDLHERIHCEIKRRITIPFLKDIQHWEKLDNNWSAVCGGCVGMALIYEFPDEFKAAEKRILGAMDSYLGGFGNDGICPEGLGYWKYGFRYFTAFAELYKERYGADFFSGDKIKNIAKCQQYMIFGNDVSVSFSDCARDESYDIPIAAFYRRIYGDVYLPDIALTGCLDNCGRYLGATRAFLWSDDNICCGYEKGIGEKYFEDAKWYINKREKFMFAAKAGNNGESHNHNDIGSFIVMSKDGQILADYGAGEYTREYFSDERYDYICNSSLGHSVPVIDGIPQSAGKKFHGDVLAHSGNMFIIEFSKAYDSEHIRKIERKFEISDICVKISDLYEFNDDKAHDITERFVSVKEPRIADGKVMIGSVVLISDNMPELSSRKLKDHDGNEDTIHFIDYKNIKDSFDLCIKKTP